MSKSECERAWGTAGWLDDHELAGPGDTRQCQRKTKTHLAVRYAACSHARVNVGKVFRKTFANADPELCAAFLWGAADLKRDQRETLYDLAGVVHDFLAQDYVEDARVTTFTYDVPSGAWRAIVVFRRAGK